ncbi:TPA: LOW QUALITY PROTEIN: hypothetical protein N0F65_001073 [Lagenidium giganteum]|uniref:Uncharacterized protein n=1 Tax=Lagenidium giganteum TaxID=4803 RepID=A0AAV2YLN1_9STRA|nr:TPA: LOW QUALITY PROTEIN: hypothetical protein N0F65_001073 [Lagenidium giganteum]
MAHMFSLDVVQWRNKHLAKEAEAKKKPKHAEDPHAAHDRRSKQIYGRTAQEMHETYLERVSKWVDDIPKQEWANQYGKEAAYPTAYVPRERHKAKEHGGPVVKTGPYSPQAVFKGGGECVQRLNNHDAPAEERDVYQVRMVNFGKTREKEKEIQPPMFIPKNKSLHCAKYFVEDILSAPSPTRQSKRGSAHREDNNGPRAKDPTTAEYVASPQWRSREPKKWVAGEFTTTFASTSPHTAMLHTFDGEHTAPTVLAADPYLPCKNPNLVPNPQTYAMEHERRAKTAAAVLQRSRSPQKAERRYFNSMLTDPHSAQSPRRLLAGARHRPTIPHHSIPSTKPDDHGRHTALIEISWNFVQNEIT